MQERADAERRKMMKRIEITIEGMHCEACVAKLNSAFEALEGVSEPSVLLGSASLVLNEAAASTKAVLDVVAENGFKVTRFSTQPA